MFVNAIRAEIERSARAQYRALARRLRHFISATSPKNWKPSAGRRVLPRRRAEGGVRRRKTARAAAKRKGFGLASDHFKPGNSRSKWDETCRELLSHHLTQSPGAVRFPELSSGSAQFVSSKEVGGGKRRICTLAEQLSQMEQTFLIPARAEVSLQPKFGSRTSGTNNKEITVAAFPHASQTFFKNKR